MKRREVIAPDRAASGSSPDARQLQPEASALTRADRRESLRATSVRVHDALGRGTLHLRLRGAQRRPRPPSCRRWRSPFRPSSRRCACATCGPGCARCGRSVLADALSRGGGIGHGSLHGSVAMRLREVGEVRHGHPPAGSQRTLRRGSVVLGAARERVKKPASDGLECPARHLATVSVRSEFRLALLGERRHPFALIAACRTATGTARVRSARLR